MAENKNDIPASTKIQVKPWYQLWFLAVSRPFERTYSELLQSYNPASRSPYVWLFISSIFASYRFFLQKSIFTNTFRPFNLICTPIIWGLLGGIIASIIASIMQFISSYIFHGEGSRGEFLFLYSSIYAPVTILRSLSAFMLGTRPFAQFIIIACDLYEVLLLTIAAKSLNRFGWLQSLISVVPLTIGFVLINYF